MTIFASPFDPDRPRPGEPRARRVDDLDRALLGHDLRGALNGVVGGLAVMDLDAMTLVQREQVESVAAAVETVRSLLVQMLGEVTDRRDPAPIPHDAGEGVDVSGLLDSCRRRWTSEARRKGLVLRVVAEADAPNRLMVPPSALPRILGNLVGNAIRHCASGGIELVALATRGGGILFRVADNGPGVSEETLERARRDILNERLDPKAPAHGLGLHVVRQLAGQIGAELTLRNRDSGGFEARIELPPEKCTHAEPEAPKAEADLLGARILLAEDNPTNQMVATQMLHALRAEVTVASDGLEALAAFEKGDFDLVVLDIEMPRVSGLDVIRRIRGRSDARARVPIVALTAYAMREHQERISKAGANGLISKPINGIEALGRALAAHLPPGIRGRARDPAGNAGVVDQTIYDALAQAIGPELMNELIEKVVADLGAARTDLETARPPRDTRALRAASHILISVAGAIGAVGLQSRARSLNTLSHEDGPLDQGVADCVAEIDAVLAFLAGDG